MHPRIVIGAARSFGKLRRSASTCVLMRRYRNKSLEGLDTLSDRIPTIPQMIREGKASARRIRDSEILISTTSRDTLSEWFDQAHRLTLARHAHRLKGTTFRKFAEAIGISGSRAFEIEQLDGFKDVVFTRCEALERLARDEERTYRWPGWRAALAIAMPYKADKAETVKVLTDKLAEKNAEIRSLQSQGFGRPVSWKHDSDEWATPPKLFEFLDGFFHFDVDVCAGPENAKCKRYHDRKTDGLKQVWKPGEAHWLNPPYSRVAPWAEKADHSARQGAIIVALLANRSATGWYRDYVAPSAAIVLLYGRMAFGHHSEIDMSGAPFAAILAIWPRSAVARITKHCRRIETFMMEMPK